MRCHEIKSEIRDSIISLAGAATGTIFVATKLL